MASKLPVWRTDWARRHLRLLLNVWPPLLFAGIRVTRLDPDFRAADVELRLHWWNRNYVGTHFGGSLFAMTDPFYMLLLIENLGRDYIVWDKAASIRYRRPGRGTVRAEFRLTGAEIDEIRALLETAPKQTAPKEAANKEAANKEAANKIDRVFQVRIVDAAGEVVAEVEKVVHVRRK